MSELANGEGAFCRAEGAIEQVQSWALKVSTPKADGRNGIEGEREWLEQSMELWRLWDF